MSVKGHCSSEFGVLLVAWLLAACGGRVASRVELAATGADPDAGMTSTGGSASSVPSTGNVDGRGVGGAGGTNVAGASNGVTNGGARSVPGNVTAGGRSTSGEAGAPGVSLDAGLAGASNPDAQPAPSLELSSYALAPATAEGRLVGARWNGTEEIVALIDPVTTNAQEVGVLGDLQTWSTQLVYEPWSRNVYAAGYDGAQAPHLYSVSLGSDPRPPSLPIARLYVLGGSDGDLIGAYWTGSEESLVQIGPFSGDTLPLGVLGDLHWWSNQLVYDTPRRVAYAIGGNDNTSVDYRLYTFSADTKACTSVPIDRSYVMRSVADDGRLIGAYWNDAEEVVVLIDPTTGASTQVGVFGDLHYWSNQMAYDPEIRVVYAIGTDWNDVAHVYHVDLGG